MDEISEGAWRIRLPLPWELSTVNAFLFRLDDGFLLIDCGLNTDKTFETFDSAFREIGADWKAVRRIVASHMHPDHFGGAGRARKLSGAPVAISPVEAKMVAPRDDRSEFFGRAQAYLRNHGVPEPHIAVMKEAAREVADRMDRFIPDETIDEGDVIEYRAGRLETIHTPGHSPGLLCFYEREKKILYSTDMILQRITPNVGVHWFSSGNPLGEYLDSLAKLEPLECSLVVPSHGPPFEGLQRRIAEKRSHHRRRAEKTVEAARDEASAYEIAGRIWGEDKPPQERRFAMAEGLAHLEYLARIGRVERREVDGVVLWKAA